MLVSGSVGGSVMDHPEDLTGVPGDRGLLFKVPGLVGVQRIPLAQSLTGVVMLSRLRSISDSSGSGDFINF